MHLVPVLLLAAAAGIPVACWLARNYFVFGDLMGFALNNRFKTWTPKPISEYWHHPIFTPSGFLYFWSRLAITIWRGEMYWYGDDLAAAPIDAFYFFSSTAFLLKLCHRGHRRNGEAAGPRPAWLPGCAGCCSPFPWPFWSWSPCPSISALPFTPRVNCRSFLRTVDHGIARPVSDPVPGGIRRAAGMVAIGFPRVPLLIVIVDFIVMSEISYSMQVFASQYNWFHLP